MSHRPEIVISSDFSFRGISVSLACVRASVTVTPDAVGLGAALDAASVKMARLLEEQGGALSALPGVRATRKAYKALGKDPARYRPAAEALSRRIIQGKGLSRVNTVVDVNNLVSIRSGISIGAYDLSHVESPVAFRRAGAGESHIGIGRGPLNLEGLPILADVQGPFGCPTSDSERTMITLASRQVLLVLFGFDGTPDLASSQAETAAALERFCQGREVETWTVSD